MTSKHDPMTDPKKPINGHPSSANRFGSAARPIERGDLLGAATVWCASFLLYVRTLAPTVTGEDSGELIAAAYTLGIPHPPGYPLWCLLAKLFTFIPVGDIAYRCNLMSAFFGALCCSLVFFISSYVTGQRLPAATAALVFAASREFWSQCVIAEVYSLTLFFALAVLYLVILWRDRRDERLLKTAALLFGFGLTPGTASGSM